MTSHTEARTMSRELRFSEKYEVDAVSGCWLWVGSIMHKGYGVLQFDGRTERAHRVAHILFVGPIPEGLCVLHRCDVRSCVNPDHLWLGTIADNNRDKKEKGRESRGVDHWSAKLFPAAVRDIRDKRMSQGAYAKIYGVTRFAVGLAQRRQTWRHVE